MAILNVAFNAHSAGPFLLLLLSSSFPPASHMVTKTESTNEYRSAPPARPSPRFEPTADAWIKQNKVN